MENEKTIEDILNEVAAQLREAQERQKEQEHTREPTIEDELNDLTKQIQDAQTKQKDKKIKQQETKQTTTNLNYEQIMDFELDYHPTGLSITKDAKILASINYGQLKLHELDLEKKTQTEIPHNAPQDLYSSNIKITPDANLLITGLNAWQRKGASIQTINNTNKNNEITIKEVDWFLDYETNNKKRYIVTQSHPTLQDKKTKINIVEINKENETQEIITIPTHELVRCAKITQDIKYLITTDWRAANIFSLNTENKTYKKEFSIPHHGWTYALNITPNGEYIATGSEDKNVRVFKLDYENKKFQELLHIPQTQHTWSLAITPDAKYLVVGEEQGPQETKTGHIKLYKLTQQPK